MKTILHIIDSTEPGGAETVFVQLADELRKKGYRSITVVSGPGWVTDELRRRGFEPIIINAKGAFNWRLVRGLIRIVRTEKVDLIQSHLLGSNVYSALVGLITRKPVIATFHGMVDVSPNERLRWLKFQIMNLGVDQFVAVSKKLCDAVHKEKLLNPNKTTVIYNGVNMQLYGRKQGRELRERISVAGDALLVGSLGNLHPAKGYEFLIQAAAKLNARYSNVHFVIAGDIKQHLIGDLNRLMQSLGVSHRVHFIGFVTDSASFLSQLDFFLLPSISEGFSIATIEAMATGLPLIVTRCGGPEEIVSDGEDAMVVDVADSAAICAAVEQLIDSPLLVSRISAKAKQSVEGRFGIDAMIGKYEALYANYGKDI